MIKRLDNSIEYTNRAIAYLLHQKYIARDSGYVLEERQVSDVIDNMQKTLKLLIEMREKQDLRFKQQGR